MDHHPATLSLAKIQNHPARTDSPQPVVRRNNVVVEFEQTDEPVLPLPQHLHLLCSRAHHVDTVRHSVAAASGRTDVPVHPAASHRFHHRCTDRQNRTDYAGLRGLFLLPHAVRAA